jgi:HD superfamily phosphohydrolase YqeK
MTDYFSQITTLLQNVTNKRRLHSEGVAAEISTLQNHFLLGDKLLTLAGLAHDLGREMKIEEMLGLRHKINFPAFPPEFIQNPILLHGPTAVYLLRNENINLPNFCERAIIFHPVGDPQLHADSLLLSIADMIEKTRSYADVEELRRFVYQQNRIEIAAYKLFKRKITWAEKSMNKVDDNTFKTVDNLLKCIRN